MKRVVKNVFAFSIGLALLTACNSPKKGISSSQNEINTIELVQKAKAAIFKNYNEKDVRTYLKDDYIQHNPHVPTGIEPIIGLLPILKESGTSCQTHRVFQDEDFVVMHNTYTNAEPFGAKEIVAFDIWRTQNGKVVEHWDAVTPKVTETASGRTQTDGETQLTDLDNTAENKALVKKLVEEVFIGGNSDNITSYISTEQYDQHNPMVKDGLSGLSEAITYLTSIDNMFKYSKIHKLLGQGNFVLVQAEGEWNNKPHVFYDLFRVKDGKVVEHWDVVNEIPEKMAHNNGIF